MDFSRDGGAQSALIIVVALIAVGLVLALIGVDQRAPQTPAPNDRDRSTIAALQPPPVPPALFAAEAPDRARASNAAVPLAPGPVVAAAPFHYAGLAPDRAAALACLSVAILYEAGDDPPGERAVAQVILNRLRHPAFPKTVCGVIFQGAERTTGCQFTFTCDGALARVPSPPALARARTIADAALSGAVYAPVGTATHYHTDWVVPYWRSSLEKIAIVHTQIFYRWPGRWGSRAVLAGRVAGREQPDMRVARLAQLTPATDSPLVAEQAALPLPGALAVAGVPQAALHGSVVRLKDEEAGQFVIQFNPDAAPASFAISAFNLCGDRPECTILGWTDARDVPRALPILPWMMRSLAFVYRKSRTLGITHSSWDCSRFPRKLPSQCLNG